MHEYALVDGRGGMWKFPTTRSESLTPEGIVTDTLVEWDALPETAVELGRINRFFRVVAVGVGGGSVAGATWLDAREVNRLVALGRVSDSLTLAAWALHQAQSAR